MTNVEQAIELVHELDALTERRKQLVAAVDAEMAEIRQKLAALTGTPFGPVDARQPATLRGAATGRSTAVATMSVTTVGDRLLAELEASPGADYGDLATRLYGSNNDTFRNRLRSAIHTLSKGGKIRKVNGRWEAVKPSTK